MKKFFIGVLLCSLAGCGLGNYEKRIDEQSNRVKKFDELNALLDDPLEMPTGTRPFSKEAASLWPEFFLRLPKGFGTTAKDKERLDLNFLLNNSLFKVYTGSEQGIVLFIAAAGVADIAEPPSADEQRYTPKRFRDMVKETIQKFYDKENFGMSKGRLPPYRLAETPARSYGVTKWTPVSGPADPVTYSLITLSDAGNKYVTLHKEFLLFFNEDKPKQIAIVLQRPVPMPNEAAFMKSLDASLGTLDLSSDAASRRAQFLNLRKR